MSEKNNGGPAFPVIAGHYVKDGMTLRDWFAATIQYDASLMEDVSRCDDRDLLERFGLEEEKDEYFSFVLPEEKMPFKNIDLRARLESRARAHIRFIEADAMLKERDK